MIENNTSHSPETATAYFARKAPRHTARVLRLLRQAMSEMNGAQRAAARPRAHDRSKSAT
ncbi:MAG: hypothetical protein Q7T73_12550 [Beijerinckiaceae bacterium]|nr:hypothetical protein [Beijerinckiaceae bacterium]